MNFLKNVLASILGTFIVMGLFSFLFLVFIISLGNGFAAMAEKDSQTVKVYDNSILNINLSKPLKDYGGKYAFTDLNYKYENYDGLNNILHAINYAKTDSKIKGISINTALSSGLAQTQAIRKAINAFKESGKFVYAYGDIYGQKDYYLASVADSIFINPVGELDFKGLSSEVLFYKDFQEKSGIKMEVVRHGKYKSAVEPYLENQMSDANRQQVSELLSSLWKSIVGDIADSRTLDVNLLNTVANNLSARSAAMAKEKGLVDAVAFFDEYEDKLIDATDKSYINYIDIDEYAEFAASKGRKSAYRNKIAVIYAQGDILFGEGNDMIIGQGIMTKAIRKAKEDKNVKAIVLRVDSPGGAAIVADMIWRELELAKQEKPVVVSMGDVAASGGYYIAAGANKIFAEPTTITGSIGVFSAVPNIKGLADKLGINAEQVGTHNQSSGYSFFENMSDDFRSYLRKGTEDTYATFLQRVANGRSMTIDAVNTIAQGRVWSGVDALENGLVDELGGIYDAIDAAADLAEITSYNIETLPEYKTSIEDVIERLSGFPLVSGKQKAIKEEIGVEAYNWLQKIKTLVQQKGVQARLPFELQIR
jgi:protease-4